MMQGELYVVGIGPGDEKGLTAEARLVLQHSDLICGYSGYISLIEPIFPDKKTFSNGMRKEIDRCRSALAEAQSGKVVSLICSGDAGVYGMAGPILELAPSYPGVNIEIVAGVTAAQSGAAVLGAPLCHDFAVVSLSDLLTPWNVIEKRLEAASSADFCLCLYNPRSKKRAGHLMWASEVMLKHKPASTVCGWVRNIARDQQESATLLLEDLGTFEADMFTTIFVGNTETKLVEGRMVTPRGYGGLS